MGWKIENCQPSIVNCKLSTEKALRQKLKFIFALFVATVAVMALQKPVFMLWYAEESAAVGGWGALWSVVRHGLSLDMTVAGYITALPLLGLLASLWVNLDGRLCRAILKGYLVTVALLVAAIFAVDLGLYASWGFRIDATVFIYLTDPKEAMASVDFALFVKQFLLFAAYAALISWLYLRVAGLYEGRPVAGIRGRVTASLVMLLLAGFDFLAIRGGIYASVANISKVYFSSEMFLNHAATNPVFSLLSTVGEESDFASEYPFYDEPTLEDNFARLCRGEEGAVERVIDSMRPNVVIVILEGFGRNLMDERVDGEWVLPNMQRLKEEGVWFENFYANSFRTDRGEVAVLSGYPAQTRTSIMKLPAKSRSLPSIARSLAAEGYRTTFTYGGDLNFTDQSSYMYATGWQELTWQKDLRLDAKMSAWGYHDDVVCDYFAEQVIALAESGEQFLAGLLTLSNHEPFDVPFAKFENRILNSAAFSDECLGRMIERLKASPAWDNLLVVLLPDHALRYPDSLEYNIPYRHHIPMIWTGGAVLGPRTVARFGSQIDLAATLLGQLGVPYDDFAFSKNMFAEGVPAFGYYAFNDGFGVVAATGEAVWDATSGREVSVTDPALLDVGRTMLQSTYLDLDSR